MPRELMSDRSDTAKCTIAAWCRAEDGHDNDCKTMSELADLRVQVAKLAKWVVHRGTRGKGHPFHGDHACARCFPDDDLIIDGFVCAYHLAIDLAGEDP